MINHREVWVDWQHFDMMTEAEERMRLSPASLCHARLEGRSIVLDRDGQPHVVSFFPPGPDDAPPRPPPPPKEHYRGEPLLAKLTTHRLGVYRDSTY